MIDVRYEIKRLNFSVFLVYLLSHSDLRPSDTHAKYLREVKSHYNYRLVKPQKNLTCKEQCEAVNGFQEYYESYKDDMLDVNPRHVAISRNNLAASS